MGKRSLLTVKFPALFPCWTGWDSLAKYQPAASDPGWPWQLLIEYRLGKVAQFSASVSLVLLKERNSFGLRCWSSQDTGPQGGNIVPILLYLLPWSILRSQSPVLKAQCRVPSLPSALFLHLKFLQLQSLFSSITALIPHHNTNTSRRIYKLLTAHWNKHQLIYLHNQLTVLAQLHPSMFNNGSRMIKENQQL